MSCRIWLGGKNSDLHGLYSFKRFLLYQIRLIYFHLKQVSSLGGHLGPWRLFLCSIFLKSMQSLLSTYRLRSPELVAELSNHQ